MSDWQAGDLALCVNDGVLHCGHGKHDASRSVKSGAVIRVDGIGKSSVLAGYGDCDCDVLIFGSGQGLSMRFVKITPGHKTTGSEVDQKQPWKVGV